MKYGRKTEKEAKGRKVERSRERLTGGQEAEERRSWRRKGRE